MDKPTCKRCGEPHWRFVKCIEAPAENAYDVARLKASEGTLVPVPISRAHARPPVLTSRNFTQQAPGVYRRRRDND